MLAASANSDSVFDLTIVALHYVASYDNRLHVGRLDEFDAATDAVESYAERAQLFFEANDIAAGKQTAVFLSAIGTKTYQLLRDLMAPTLPKEKSFEDIVGVLNEHFQPKPLVIAERFYFHRSQQGVGESIADFVA